MRYLPVLPALALAAALPSHAADISVGAGAFCTVHTIGEALDIARTTDGPDTIRLANDQAYANQSLIIDTSLTLTGGFASCNDTEPSGQTAIIGTHIWPTLWVAGAPQNLSEVRLEHIDVSGGSAGDIGLGGGLAVTGRALVSIADAQFHHNSNTVGGGISLNGAGTIVVLERNVDIHDNAATRVGGGVLVEGGALRVRPHNVTVRDNTAGNGGGVAIVASGSVSVSSDIDDRDTPINGFLIRNNAANNLGGGVFVHGAASNFLADDTVVRNNSAAEGGGVYAGNGGYAQLARFREGPFRHCPLDMECLRVSDNIAGRGGAVAVRSGAVARIDDTIVRGNSADAGTAFALHGEPSRLSINGSLVVRNPCTEAAPGCAAIVTTGGFLAFEHTTFADNADSDSLVYGEGDEGALITHIQGQSSLVAGKDWLFAFDAALPTVHYDCILKDRGVVEATAERSDVQPVVFQNAERGDYHLAPGNAAIDYCDDAPVSSLSPDLEDTPRGQDSPGHADHFGRHDLGALEFDRIFASGVEARR